MIGRRNHGLVLFQVPVLGGSDRSGSERMDDDDCHTNRMDALQYRFFHTVDDDHHHDPDGHAGRDDDNDDDDDIVHEKEEEGTDSAIDPDSWMNDGAWYDGLPNHSDNTVHDGLGPVASWNPENVVVVVVVVHPPPQHSLGGDEGFPCFLVVVPTHRRKTWSQLHEEEDDPFKWPNDQGL
jgi:hypothetical protein